jgi:4-hydroxybutyrate dehydrogenase
MAAVLPLPRLVFGFDCIGDLPGELALLGVRRPLLMSDSGLVKAGAAARVFQEMPANSSQYLDTPENPTTAGADAAYAAYRTGSCDSIVSLGGGSVIDTAKIVAAMAGCGVADATTLLQNPGSINRHVAPLIAIPTTVGTGSESSPVAALHYSAHGMAVGTRSPFLVPRVAICDPSLARSLPPRLIAATGFDALSHCLEGFFAEPENPIIDALALDGLTRAFSNLYPATQPDGDAARAGLMAAAFAGGAAIH